MLTISLLGEQLVHDDASGAVRTRSSRTTALIGFLAAHTPRPQSRQLIAGLFWPDSGDGQALTNLRRELHHLRELLGDLPVLSVTASDLTWHDHPLCRVDISALRRSAEQAREAADERDLERAVTVAADGIHAYGGDFLPGRYDDWAVELRDALRAECVALCDLVAEAGWRHGSMRLHLEAARRRIELAPLEEVGYRVLMGLQAEMGDRGGAISTYHHCAAVLERELGVEPDPATRAALDRLMRRDPRQSAAAPRPARSSASAHAAHGAGPPPLLGRDREMAALLRLWASARSGSPLVAVVRGRAGVGKTRLVDELVRRVRGEGAIVAQSRCVDSSGRLALAPVADWLSSPSIRSGTALLEPVWRREVHRLVPEAAEEGVPDSSRGRTGRPAAPAPARAGDRAMVDAWQQHRFHTGLAQAFLSLQEPLLLVLDDLQWCDEETLSWVAFLLGSGGGRPLMLVATLRDSHESDADATQRVQRLRHAIRTDELALEPLDPAATATLAERLTGQPLTAHEAEVLQAATAGFPLYVVEASRAGRGSLLEDAPGTRLDALLRRRITQSSPAAQEVAALAAAFGREVSLDLLTEASDLDADSVAEAVDELWREHVLREIGAGYDFSHDLLRVAAYDRVSPPHRWLLHRRLAQALQLSAPGRGEAVAGQLAEQYERGGRPERALPAYRQAAEVAGARFAFTEAVRLHRRALAMVELLPAGDHRDRQRLDGLLSIAAPLVAREGYAAPSVQAVLERAVDLARAIGSDEKLVAGLVGLWSSRFVQGRVLDSYTLVLPALALPRLADEQRGQVHFAVAGSAMSLGRPAEAVQHFEEAARLGTGTQSIAVGTHPDVHAEAWSAHACWLLGEADAAGVRAAGAVDRARNIGHPFSLAVALAYAGITHQMRDDRPALRAACDELMELGDQYGFAYYPEWGRVLLGWLEGGEVGVARIHRGIANLRHQHSLARMPYWLALLAETQRSAGAVDACRASLDAASACAQSTGDTWWLPEVLRLRAGRAAGEDRARQLAAAATLAEEQGSVALLARCRADGSLPRQVT
jgi:DNA-binding SARP family transcriptional activator/tetratricopeptide (TPR) repeat protein